ncbi:hypothetical protein [Blastococcus saxobsidens]|uniref:Uncharacterized protein n=1 Tax=Blastococcus saxobsidens (strain DD2) TaxID=1146883 RepID=H6RR59_BLASD|nr:hypothetical protein [Blastococcus saxobsidens]CCG04139.1 conserved membrane protein of unknown function [Blastococcus saxobsidens DD2]
MSLSSSPAPARTDTVAATPAPRTSTRPVASTRLVRAAGTAVATGSAAWAAGILAFDVDPAPGWQGTLFRPSSLLFQLGLAALVTVQLRTGATGTGRLARGFLHAEHLLLGLAITSTLTWMFLREHEDQAWFIALDAFWPLSMLGMAAIGVRIAIAGRWQGRARSWPLVAESWAPVTVPTAFLLPAITQYVRAAHLLIGYVVLGVILATRPHLTGARD